MIYIYIYVYTYLYIYVLFLSIHLSIYIHIKKSKNKKQSFSTFRHLSFSSNTHHTVHTEIFLYYTFIIYLYIS